MKSLLLTLPALLLATPALAQWRSTDYALKPGWNAIWLNGDATYLTPDQHFASQPDVEEVWRWNPNPDSVQFTDSPSQPTPGTPEWSVWRRGQPQYSDLTLLTGQSSYLVKLRDGAAQQTLTMKQRVEPPRTVWRRSGANLLAFPSKKNGTQFPAISTYFSTYPEATAAKVYRYNGGPLTTANPVRIVSMSTERLDSTQAYWFEAKTVSDFMGPLHFEVSDPTGLNFGRTGSVVAVTVRNRTAAVQTLTFSGVNSETPPDGQAAIAGPVVLTRRNYNTSSTQYEDTPFSAPFTATVPANGSAQFLFGVNRAAMTGPAGSLFASILRITDAANMMDVNLPVSAGASSLAGLWVGDAELTNVESKTPGFTGTKTDRAFPLRYLIHVDAAGRATLLSQVYLGSLNAVDTPVGIATAESLLAPAFKDKAMRLTSAHLPLDRAILTSGGFGAGGTVTGTVSLPYNDPVNPFVHQYHPDHDNKDARFQPLPAGKESYTVNRAVTFTFPANAPAGQEAAWGSRVLTGDYSETVTGIHKQPITATGTFILRRVSEIATLTSP